MGFSACFFSRRVVPWPEKKSANKYEEGGGGGDTFCVRDDRKNGGPVHTCQDDRSEGVHKLSRARMNGSE